jgi:hypothetical protein
MSTKFISKDFYLSAYLISSGFALKDHKREKGFTTFIFENSGKLQELVNQFYSLKAQTEPIKYSQAIRSLKGVIHSSVSTSNQDTNNVFINFSEGTK